MLFVFSPKGEVKATFDIVTVEFHGQKCSNQCSQDTDWEERPLLSKEGKSLLTQLYCIRRGRSGLLAPAGRLWGYRDVGMLGYAEEGMWGLREEGMQGHRYIGYVRKKSCGEVEMWRCWRVGKYGCRDAGRWEVENPHSSTDTSALHAWEWFQFLLQHQPPQQPYQRISPMS